MTSRTHIIAVAGLLAAWTAAPPVASAIPVDIRGLTFTSPHTRTETEGGTLVLPSGPTPIETFPPDMNGMREQQIMTPLPHTFDVVADPAFPADPGRIQVNTRLFFPGPGPVPACPALLFPLELPGTYNPVTGAIAVNGTRVGSFFHHIYSGPDPFGLFGMPIEIIAQYTNLGASLNGNLTEAGGVLTITGTDPYVPFGGPGNFTIASASVFVTPLGECNPANAIAGPITVQNPYGGIYGWTAVNVPEPAAGLLLAAVALAGRRSRAGRAGRAGVTDQGPVRARRVEE